MKRLTALLLATGLLLCGCAREEAAPPPSIDDFMPETAPPTEPTTEQKAKTPEELLSEMTLDQKIHQLFIITPEALTGYSQVVQFGGASKTALREHPVGGIVYFSQNLEDTAQTRTMLSDTLHYAISTTGVGVFLAVDEEGGQVARVAESLGTNKFSPMQKYGNRDDADEAFEIGQTIGSDIRHMGFNLDFAPVADVNLSDTNELGDRIFSDDPYVVSNMVSAVVKGLQSSKVAATLKHFPGLGAEDGNAHTDDKIIIDRSLYQLRETEFIPFIGGIQAGADFVMVSHQIVTGIGDNLPASLSETVCTEILREELEFDGIIITDSFQMNTISGKYSSDEAAVMAIEAGVDMILMPDSFTTALDGIRDAVEEEVITEERIDESVLRILKEKQKLGLLEP